MTQCSADTNTVTVVVADDHLPFADGLARTLPERCGARVVACCEDGRTALAAIVEHVPDVAMLDLRMPALGGRGVLAEVVRLKLSTRVLFCSVHGEAAIVRAVLDDGARGYVSKSASWEQICTALRTVACGGVWISPELRAGVDGGSSGPRRALSPRELEVLRLAAQGLTDAQIGAHMYISRETVRTNLKRCSEKLGVSGRTALVATALREGLLE